MREFTATLTVALSGRVLAFDWAGGGVLWRAERQTVARIERPVPAYPISQIMRQPYNPGDPDGRLAVVIGPPPSDSDPIRLDLPAQAPVLPVCHDDSGWCMNSSERESPPARVLLSDDSPRTPLAQERALARVGS
jgi:hypothetical protein